MQRTLSRMVLFTLLSLASFCSAWAAPNNMSDISNRYLKNRLQPTDKRFPSFELVLTMLHERGAKMLVETGTARCGAQNFVGDGGSTIIFGDWAKQHKALLYSVDINPQSVINSQNATKQFGDNVQVICSDSVAFLTNFNQPIDFLYVDSYDFDINNPTPSQQHHLREIVAAYPRLHYNSLVMIDDCDLPHGGKGSLVIKYLLERGWVVVYQGYQVILAQWPL